MYRKVLLALIGAGLAGLAVARQAGAGGDSDITPEKRGMILGTMAHLKSVKLKEAPAIPIYVVNNDNIKRADPETAQYIFGLLRNCQLDFWDR